MTDSRSALTVLAAGRVDRENFAALASGFATIEQIDLPHTAREPFESRRAELNRAIDAATNGWILILREHEVVDGPLAAEIASVTGGKPPAWGFRIRSQPHYCGKPLRLGNPSEGEIRLVHRRHGRFDLPSGGREMKVEGPVMRLRNALRGQTFAAAAEHREHLARTAVPHSAPRRVLLFLRNAIVTGAWARGTTTLHYLWIEAGFDHGRDRHG